MSDAPSRLRERCRAFLARVLSPDLPDDSEVDDLVDFVLSEIGRASDERLGDAAPLVLYFADDSGRRELVEAIMEANPGMIARTWPR